jgi:hypothetical protein
MSRIPPFAHNRNLASTKAHSLRHQFRRYGEMPCSLGYRTHARRDHQREIRITAGQRRRFRVLRRATVGVRAFEQLVSPERVRKAHMPGVGFLLVR